MENGKNPDEFHKKNTNFQKKQLRVFENEKANNEDNNEKQQFINFLKKLRHFHGLG